VSGHDAVQSARQFLLQVEEQQQILSQAVSNLADAAVQPREIQKHERADHSA
jgi:hypothetical protein